LSIGVVEDGPGAMRKRHIGQSHKSVSEYPGKPTDNAFIESFKGSLRDECLNVRWFQELTDARDKLWAWMQECNESRPHRSLNNLSPLEYKAKWVAKRPENG